MHGARIPAPTSRRGAPLAGVGTPVITLEEVGREYRIGSVVVTALAGVSLTVREGEFVVVLGPSGSGKTTLLNMIGALDSPTSGRVVVGDTDITAASRSRAAGVATIAWAAALAYAPRATLRNPTRSGAPSTCVPLSDSRR